MRIAVIPARGGSKRIPRKNIKPFHGKPIIAWSIEAANNSKLFDRVIVSTDDEEIAEIAREFGAETPFLRPKQLADDFTGTSDVIRHVIQFLGLENLSAVCCIYATAPFLTIKDLLVGLNLMEKSGVDFVFSGAPFPASPYRGFNQSKLGELEMLFPEHYLTRSQDLNSVYYDAAQFYWGKPDAWLGSNLVFGKNSRIIEMPKWRVHDLDDGDDWFRAELIFGAIKNNSNVSE